MRRLNIKKFVEMYGGVAEMARECGVSKQIVYRWINRNSLPKKLALKVSAIQNLDRDLLYHGWDDAGEVMSDEETIKLVALAAREGEDGDA